MIIAIGTARAVEGGRDRLLAAASAVASSSREDDGCQTYAFSVDATDPEVVLSIEVWRDQAALDAHLRHDHTRVFLDQVGDLTAGEPSMEFFDATPRDMSGAEATS